MTDSRQLTSMRGSLAIWRAACARSSSSCRAPLSLSGFPCVTSHHTRSSFSRLIANRLIARWAICGGLNEPPSRPMRMPLVWRGMVWASDGEETCASFNGCPERLGSDAFSSREPVATSLENPLVSRPRLSGAVDPIFEAGQLLGADRTSGVEFAGGYPDLRAEAELAAIGELRRCVMQHDRRIDLVEEFLRGFRVFGHDRVGMMRAVGVDMRDRFVDAVDNARCDDRVFIFGVPVLVGSGFYPRVSALHGLVAAHLAAGIDQHFDQRLEARRCSRAVDQQGLGRAADTGATHLGIEDNGLRHLEIGGVIDIDVIDAFQMREHRHPRFRLDAGDQALAAA